MNNVTIAMGGQYGSEGKGEFIAWYAKNVDMDVAVRIGGPNAGHTMTLDGKTFKMRQIPCAWHTSAELVVGPGALINPHVLEAELQMLQDNDPAGFDVSRPIFIDHHVIIVTNDHAKREADRKMRESGGSTLEGVGMARADKAVRIAPIFRNIITAHGEFPLMKAKTRSLDVPAYLNHLLRDNPNGHILVESTQGFGLSLNYSMHYPMTTSADLTPAQALNDAGLGGVRNYEVVGVMRTFPIRVADNSGPMHNELSWADVSTIAHRQLVEYTTVTGMVRRIGEWDPFLARRFSEICKPDAICLTMVDYLVPEITMDPGVINNPNVRRRIGTVIDKVERDVGVPVKWIGIGPGRIVDVKSLKLADLS